MTSSQDSVVERKTRKQRRNTGLRLHNDSEEVLEVTSAHTDLLSQPPDEQQQQQSTERLRELFEKTEEMKHQSKEKTDEVEQQFKDLRHRISKSSGFLQKVKKSIDNLKFSYQRSISDLEVITERNRADVEKHIEDIRQNIDKLQSRRHAQQPKMCAEHQGYEEAFDEVLSNFEKVVRTTHSLGEQ